MTTRDLVLISLFAAIIVALGLIPPVTLAFLPVPITAQSLGVMLAGVILGARRGTLAVLLVIVLVAAGLPVLAPGRGGLSQFVAPTSGFLYGWLAAAFVTGAISERFATRSQGAFAQGAVFFIASLVGGIFVLYAAGILWLAFVTGLGLVKAFTVSMAFIPGDVAKAVIAALAGRAVMAGYPLLPQRA